MRYPTATQIHATARCAAALLLSLALSLGAVSAAPRQDTHAQPPPPIAGEGPPAGVVAPQPEPVPNGDEPPATPAPTAPPAPVDPTLAALQAAAARAQAEADIAKAEREKFDALAPKSTTTPLAGDTTIDDKVKIESEMLAYEAVDNIAGEVSDRVAATVGTGGTTVVLYDAPTIAAIAFLEEFYTQAAIIRHAYDEIEENKRTPGELKLGAAPGLALEGVGAFARSAIDILSLFRQNTSYSGRAVDINSDALYAQVAHKLTWKNANITVLYPKLLMLDASAIGVEDDKSAKPVLAAFNGLFKARAEAVVRINEINETVKAKTIEFNKAEEEFKAQDALFKKLKTEYEAAPPRMKPKLKPALDAAELKAKDKKKIKDDADTALTEVKNRRGALLKQLETVNAMFDAFVTALMKSDVAGQTPIRVIIKASRVVTRLQDGNPQQRYMLYVGSVSAGGTYRIRKNLFTTLFTGDLLSYSGGAVVSYMLFNSKSDVVSADTLRYMTGYSKFKKLRPVPNGANFPLKQ